MVRRQNDGVAPLADPAVEKVEQILDQVVGAQRRVQDLLGVRPPGMADGVVAGKTDAQQIEGFPAAELLGVDGFLDEVEQQVIAER